MFKSYTRKSSALTGAERAGVSADNVVQLDGKWGFHVNDDAANDPVVEQVQTVVAEVIKSDRRKLLRTVYRGLKSIGKNNKQPGAPKFSNKFLRESAQRLRQSYRCADIARA